MRKYLITSSYFYDEEDDDSEPVEHVVDCCSCESAPKFVPIADLGEGDDCVGHRSANVGSHNDRNGQRDGQNWKLKCSHCWSGTIEAATHFQIPPCSQRWKWTLTNSAPGQWPKFLSSLPRRDFSANHFSGIFRLIFNKYWHLGYFYHIDHVTCGPTTNQTKGWGQKVQRANEKIKKHKNSDGFSDTNPDSHRFFAWFQF